MHDIQGLLSLWPKHYFLLPSRSSITLINCLLPRKENVFTVLLYACTFWNISDPSELSVNWSSKIEQLMKCSTAEEYQSFLFSLLSSSFYYFPLIVFLYLSFMLFLIKRRLLEKSGSVLVIITELFILTKLKINCDKEQD